MTDADVLELRALVARLETRVSALETRGRPLSRRDSELRQAIATSTRGLRFTAADLVAHAAVDADLGAAIDAALLDRASVALGVWLRDHAGTHDGVTITRARRRWLCTCDR